MDSLRFIKDGEGERVHQCGHDGYEFYRTTFLPLGTARQCLASRYEVPPGKAAFPYHYHYKNEETFYILSGTGLLRTPEGERTVTAGDFVFFPANENGAHKLTNSSDTEMLVYLDFDVKHEVDVCFYPDSGKYGIWGRDINRLFRAEDKVGYYDGE